VNVTFALVMILLCISGREGKKADYEGLESRKVQVVLKSGREITGFLIGQDSLRVWLRTQDGLKIEISKRNIESVAEVKSGKYGFDDPNYSRLLFSPTGWPLGKGHGYFSDTYVFFPSVAYGLTDNLSLLGGFSVFPGVSFRDQIYFLAPRIGTRFEKGAISAGLLWISAGKEHRYGIVYGVGSVGERDRSLTFGIGFGYASKESGYEISNPIFLIGGNLRLSSHISLLTENWIITGHPFDIESEPYSLALRFFGRRLSVDLGVVFNYSILKEGFPIPWLSFAYHFGKV